MSTYMFNEATNPKKGQKNGLCYRRACLSPHNVIFYNHSTRKYYCPKCAGDINEMNFYDAMRIFGHDLCTRDEEN